ncbi:serine hydrolase [Brachybacterium sp. YJGR34]|uniref:serine hydrolase domain-containing protein n=1 Tax=Brachybacterium sp. YJGR34 TaxID=2059911 RepID=UPI000E0B7D76|nr:serine hydrolase domain-containing protein [Brachybacterium sp. YJGR34]
MSSLDLLDDFGVEAAAIVLGPEGVRETRGDLRRARPWRSVSKVLTGFGVVLAAQEGRVGLDDPAGPPGATLRHLLSHASGCFYESASTLQAPGQRRHYSNYGIDEAARHLERSLGRDLEDWIQERVASPLGMEHLRWGPSAAVDAVGPLEDLALLAAELLRPTLLEPAWYAELTRPQFPDLVGIMPGFGKQSPNPFGLGVEIRGTKSPHWTGTRNSEGTVGHFGMRGTAFWVDPVADLALVVGTSLDFCDTHREVMPRLADAVLAEHAPSA